MTTHVGKIMAKKIFEPKSVDNMEGYLVELDAAIKAISLEEARRLGEMIYETSERGGVVYVFGNGDSANNAFHFTVDLSKGTIAKGQKRMRFHCLNENVALMTAWGNDVSFDSIFRQQLENLATKGDLIIGISTSGNSSNVLRAFEFAKEEGITSVALSSRGGGKLRQVATHSIIAKTDNVEVAEAIHWVISDLVKYYLIGKLKGRD